MKKVNEIKFSDIKITYHKPSIFKKILYKLKILKDPKYNGKKINHFLNDEIGQFGIDPYKNHLL